LAYFIIIGVIAVLFMIGWFFWSFMSDSGNKVGVATPVCGIAFGLIFVVVTIFSSYHSLSYGHVGLVKNLGGRIENSAVGDGKGGIVWTAPWASVESANVQTQSKCADGRDSENNTCRTAYSAASQENTEVSVVGVINFNVDKDHISDLYVKQGANYEEKIIFPRVAQAMKDEVRKYKTADVIPNREEIRKNVTTVLKAELEPYSINVSDFLLTNIDFPNPEVKKSFDAKVIQVQNAAAAEQAVHVAEQNAKAQAATAQGKADQTRIEAEGQAAANKLVSQSLTPELIQFQMVQKLSPQIQAVGIPSGQGTIFDLGSLLTPKAPTK